MLYSASWIDCTTPTSLIASANAGYAWVSSMSSSSSTLKIRHGFCDNAVSGCALMRKLHPAMVIGGVFVLEDLISYSNIANMGQSL